MKNKNIIASMFDDTEPYMPSKQQEEGIANTQGTLAETEKSDTYGYLQKLLELERKIATTQERQIEIQAEQKRLSAQLQDSCKNIKVSLFEEDKKLMAKMPEDMAKEFGRYKTSTAEYVNNIINRQFASATQPIQLSTNACGMRYGREYGCLRRFYWNVWMRRPDCLAEHQGRQASQIMNNPPEVFF